MRRDPASVRVAGCVHGRAVGLLPAAFRRRYGNEIQTAFVEGARDAWLQGGAFAVWATMFRAVLDTLRHAAVGRRELEDAPAEPVGPASWRGKMNGMGSGFVADIKNGLRQLSRRPVVSVTAVATLALGIGATTSMFSVVHGVLLESLPYPEPDRLVRLYHADPSRGTDRGALSLPDLEDWARDASAFSSMAVYSDLPSGPLFTTGYEPLELRTAYVSGDFFNTLAVPAAMGRGLLPDEEDRDNRVVVVSHGFWQTSLGADSSLVGSTILLDDEPYRLAGVMPAGFAFPSDGIQAWMFLSVIPPSSIPLHVRVVRFLDGIGRLDDNVTMGRAREELSALSRALVERYPEENQGLESAAVLPLRETITAGVSRPLVILLAGVGAVLLIACANVAGLLLSRAAERRREVALRSALGASRARLVRQFLSESLVLAAVGGIAGVALALGLHGPLTAQLGGLIPRAGEVRIDATVLAFAAFASMLSAVLFGMTPALTLSDASHAGRLHQGGRGTASGGSPSRLWDVLVSMEVALALVLVVSSGLLLRSFWALQAVEPGIAGDRLVSLSLTFNDGRYQERPAYLAAYDRLMDRLAVVPGVTGVGSIRYAPTRRDGETWGFEIVGRPSASDEQLASLLQVSPGFFSVAGTPLLAGRELTAEDRADAPPVVVVNQAFQRRFLAGAEPLDTELRLGDTTVPIVGVVGDIRQVGPAEPARPTLYVAQAQNPRRGMTFLVATDGDPEALLAPIRTAVREVDPDQPIELLVPMKELLDGASARERFFATALGGFGVLALLLASLGIYGVVATAVGRRTGEIGTRLALGADRAAILRMVLGGAMGPVLAGVAAGTLLAWLGVRAMAAVLYGVSPRDPLTFVLVACILVTVAAAAALIPARRASRLDPVAALRAE